jgi:hypothetical protein
MPLAPSAFESAIAALTGAGSPASKAAAATAWGNAVGAMFAGVLPASTAVAAATATLKTAIESAFGNTVAATTAAALESAFAAFATTVAAGMLPLYTGTPPAGPVGFAGLLTTDQPSLDDAAAAWADALDTWAQTGTAALVAPPNTVSNWA